MFRPSSERKVNTSNVNEARTREAEATTHEAKAEARTHEAMAKAEARTHEAEAEAEPRT